MPQVKICPDCNGKKGHYGVRFNPCRTCNATGKIANDKQPEAPLPAEKASFPKMPISSGSKA